MEASHSSGRSAAARLGGSPGPLAAPFRRNSPSPWWPKRGGATGDSAGRPKTVLGVGQVVPPLKELRSKVAVILGTHGFPSSYFCKKRNS
jgi:hypothetical protein